MHKVVFVATDFPPLGGTNVQRTQGFVATLPSLGWRPAVITKALGDMPVIDSDSLGCLPPELIVHRVLDPHPETWLRRRKGVRPRDLAQPAAEEPVGPRKTPADLLLTALYVAVRPLLSNWLATPDTNRLWSAAAARYLVRLAQVEQIDALVTSSPSYSCHLAGLAAKRTRGIPWIADLTDLWVGRPGRMIRGALQARLDARMEAEVVNAADRIIVASPSWKERLGKRYGLEVFQKTRCITLGFDSSKLPRNKELRQSGPLRLVCTGAMYGTESPVPFLNALEDVLRRTGRRNVRLHLIGSAGDEATRIENTIRHNRLEDVVIFEGPKPHAWCLHEQSKADMLVLFNGPEHVETIRGRSFEYMASGKPILAITPTSGAQADILRPAGTANIVDNDDQAGLVAAIERLLDDDFQPPQANWRYIAKFDAPNITRQLSDVLNEIVSLEKR